MYTESEDVFLTGEVLVNFCGSHNRKKEGGSMEPYICTVCQYVYDPYVGDPDNGIPAGTPFADLPSDWVCPVCGVGKEAFEPE